MFGQKPSEFKLFNVTMSLNASAVLWSYRFSTVSICRKISLDIPLTWVLKKKLFNLYIAKICPSEIKKITKSTSNYFKQARKSGNA